MSMNNFTGKFRFDGRNTPNLSWLSLFGTNVGTGGADDLSFLDTLVNCSGLDVLQMGDNVFGGLLPNSIANLSTTVRELDFSYNLISGSIPVGLSIILNLQVLTLNYDQFTGTLPEDIGNIPGLQEANFSNNKLNGRIPSSFGNLSWLTDLDLSFNRLEGNVPTNLGDCKSLLSLDLRRNDLDGNIPPQLFEASSLVKLYLQYNLLQGSLPSQISELKNLQVLDMSNNNMSGTIPSSLTQCIGITNLCLQGNSFDGSIPPSFTLLTSLQLVDLSSNKLSGEIANYFSNISSLVFLNLSYNDLEGEIPTKGVFTNVSGISLVGNTELCGGIQELNLPRCKTLGHSKGRKVHSPALIAIITISCVFVGLAMVSTFYLISSRRRKASSSRAPSLREPFLRASYDMLLKATDGFSMRNMIGGGGFGSVYRGTLLLQNGVEKDVAIKVINIQQRGASKSFMVECEALRTIRHRNLVGIITACSSIDFQGNDFKALVYEFMENGSLDKWLYQLQNLSLLQRVNIAIDVAYALDYIHNEYGTPIIHCDLKPNNVLLDENMTAHVGDFGLAKLIPEISQQLHNNSSVGVRGTVGYAAPVSAAGDMYSYGIMLIEMMTAKRPTDPMFEGDLNLHKFAKSAYPDRLMEILDPSLNLDDHDGEENNHSNMYDGRAVHDNAIECIITERNMRLVICYFYHAYSIIYHQKLSLIRLSNTHYSSLSVSECVMLQLKYVVL